MRFMRNQVKLCHWYARVRGQMAVIERFLKISIVDDMK